MKTFPLIKAVSASATAAQAVRANENRKALLIFNNEEVNIVEVTSRQNAVYGQGIPVPPKSNYENLDYCQGEYWVVCDTGLTADCRVEEDIEIAESG